MIMVSMRQLGQQNTFFGRTQVQINFKRKYLVKYRKIEKILSDNMPNNKNIQLSTLVKLCKYTSKYYFKYNERALYH